MGMQEVWCCQMGVKRMNTEQKINGLLHRFLYTFAPDGTIEPQSFTTLDLPQAKAALLALIEQEVIKGRLEELYDIMKINSNDFLGNGESEIHWKTRNRITSLTAKGDK
jgi:hypothetical protein